MSSESSNTPSSPRPLPLDGAMDHGAAFAAFQEILAPDSNVSPDDAAKRIAAMLALCSLPESAFGKLRESAILGAALELLPRMRKKELLASTELLLRLMLALKQRMRWSEFGLCLAAHQLVRALFRHCVQGVGALSAFLALADAMAPPSPPSEEEADVSAKIATNTTNVLQTALSILIEKHPTRYAVIKHQQRQLKLYALDSPSLPDVVCVLANGLTNDKELVLAALLVSPRSVRDELVLRHNGGALLVRIVSRVDSTEARDLALVIAKDAARRSWECRDALLQAWLAQRRGGDSATCSSLLEALADEREAFPGEALLAALQHPSGAEDASVGGAVDALLLRPALREYLSAFHNLLETLATQLQHASVRRSSSSASPASGSLWTLLRAVTTHAPVMHRWFGVAIGAQALAAFAAEVLRRRESAHTDQRRAFEALQSPLLAREEPVAIDCDLLATLVRLLVREPLASLARELIAALRLVARDLASTELDEIVQRVCSEDDARAAESTEPLPPRHFQNLLGLFRDDRDVVLGELRGLDRVVTATALVERLRRGRALEQTLAIAFFVHDLGLDACDPMHARAFAGDAHAVAGVLTDNLEDVMFVALKGGARATKLARRVLTALAKHDCASREKLRVYQTLYRPVPALVPTELFDASGGDGSGATQVDGAECGKDGGEEEDVYQYSDCSDDDDDDDDQDVRAMDQDHDDGGAERCATQEQEQEQEQVKTEMLGRSDAADDWEMV